MKTIKLSDFTGGAYVLPESFANGWNRATISKRAGQFNNALAVGFLDAQGSQIGVHRKRDILSRFPWFKDRLKWLPGWRFYAHPQREGGKIARDHLVPGRTYFLNLDSGIEQLAVAFKLHATGITFYSAAASGTERHLYVLQS